MILEKIKNARLTAMEFYHTADRMEMHYQKVPMLNSVRLEIIREFHVALRKHAVAMEELMGEFAKGKTMMKIDRTISFRQDMIDLILAGKKTVTIRPIKPQPEFFYTLTESGLFSRKYMRWCEEDLSEKGRDWFLKQYPHGQVGDIMVIRERPGTQLKITDITVDRLHSVSYLLWVKDHGKKTNYQGANILHWQSFYAGTEYEWVKTPWVWIIEFELEKKG